MPNHKDLVQLSRKIATELRRVAAATRESELAVALQRMADEEEVLAAGLENATKVELGVN